jgi:uncharacterized membrane protein
MPYQWTPGTDTETPRWHLLLWPHRSLPRKGFVTFIAVTAGMSALPLLAVLGSPALWGLLPFLGGTLWLTWYFIQRSYADGALTEELSIWPDRITLTRRNPRGPDQNWQANPHWVRVALHPTGGRVENYITLTGGGREVELGAFLAPEERLELYRSLSDKLRQLDVNAP